MAPYIAARVSLPGPLLRLPEHRGRTPVAPQLDHCADRREGVSGVRIDVDLTIGCHRDAVTADEHARSTRTQQGVQVDGYRRDCAGRLEDGKAVTSREDHVTIR